MLKVSLADPKLRGHYINKLHYYTTTTAQSVGLSISNIGYYLIIYLKGKSGMANREQHIRSEASITTDKSVKNPNPYSAVPKVG